jgi:hypothetical protein
MVSNKRASLHRKTLCAKIFLYSDGKMFSFACLLQKNFSSPGERIFLCTVNGGGPLYLHALMLQCCPVNSGGSGG